METLNFRLHHLNMGANATQGQGMTNQLLGNQVSKLADKVERRIQWLLKKQKGAYRDSFMTEIYLFNKRSRNMTGVSSMLH